jgi:iron complex outermembrane receptor protein
MNLATACRCAYNLDQIGFVVDGIPTGRSDPFGGSPVFRYVDNENLGSVVASAGAGDVSVPSYSSLGPVVRYNSIAPQKKAGLFVSEALGQFNLRRNFIRASTGQLGPISAYVSRTKLTATCGAARAACTAPIGKRSSMPIWAGIAGRG